MRRLAAVLGASLILTISGLCVMQAQDKQKQNPNFTGGGRNASGRKHQGEYRTFPFRCGIAHQVA